MDVGHTLQSRFNRCSPMVGRDSIRLFKKKDWRLKMALTMELIFGRRVETYIEIIPKMSNVRKVDAQ